MIPGLFVLVLVGFTTVLSSLLGRRYGGLRLRAASHAAGRVLECIGFAAVLCVFNVLCGVAFILAWRALAGSFLSLYLAADPTILALSLLQGLFFYFWLWPGRLADPPANG